ncbi:MAG: hypothetical protein IJY18_04320 [Clostridia bacterium]|nr:hypothetical protein [Clostridia bacterium]
MSKSILKILVVLLCLVLCFGIVACDTSDSTDDPDDGKTDSDGSGNEDGNGDENEDGINWDDLGLEGLALIYNNKARFQVVYTTEAGSAGIRLAKSLVTKLRDLGVEVADAVSDRDADDVKSCEIIIGTNARHRGDEVAISDKYLGPDGYTMKVIGKRVVIAGGSDTSTQKAYDAYLRQQMKITTTTKSLEQLAVKDDFSYEKLTEYSITSVTVAGNDLRDYVLIQDLTKLPEDVKLEKVTAFQTDLFAATGIWLEYGNVANMDSYEHKVIIRYVENKADMDYAGFHAYVNSDKDLIIECAYWNAFDKAYEQFVKKRILDLYDDVVLAKSLSDKTTVSEVRYSDFGADGTDTKDDFDAITAAHEYANQCGQKVLADEGRNITYYIRPDMGTSEAEEVATKIEYEGIPIKTNVDFKNATFIIDDKGSKAYNTRDNSLFYTARDHEAIVLNQTQIRETFGEDIEIHVGDTEIPWLAGYITETSMVYVENMHRDFVRWGSNQGNGDTRKELYIVNPDGSLDPNTLPCFDFLKSQRVYSASKDDPNYQLGKHYYTDYYCPITKMEIYRIDDAPITIENGTFINNCCEAVAETDFVNKYHAYARGFKFMRANVTFENIVHKIENEPKWKKYDPTNPATNKYKYNIHDTQKTKEISTATYGGRQDESYPYYAFVYCEKSYKLLVKDVQLTGHTTYYEDKKAQASTGGNIPNPVAMGSYDMVVERSINPQFINVKQVNSSTPTTGLGDQRYWGIMSSNWSRNMVFEGCEINRFDAHRSMWGATIKNTTIGHTINLVGGGDLYLENVTKLAGGAGFIQVREDYGGTYSGNITLVNCEHKAYADYNTMRGGSLNTESFRGTVQLISVGYSRDQYGYFDWDFGYDSYMPPVVTVVGSFKSNAANVYVFNDLLDRGFYLETADHPEYAQHPLRITKKIIFQDMAPIPTCNPAYTVTDQEAAGKNGSYNNELLKIPVEVKTTKSGGED